MFTEFLESEKGSEDDKKKEKKREKYKRIQYSPELIAPKSSRKKPASKINGSSSKVKSWKVTNKMWFFLIYFI